MKCCHSSCLQKPRPLDPVEDEEYMKRVHGKALYHRQRNAKNESCERYHGSQKSKLPRSPVRIAQALVKGNCKHLVKVVFVDAHVGDFYY